MTSLYGAASGVILNRHHFDLLDANSKHGVWELGTVFKATPRAASPLSDSACPLSVVVVVTK